MRRVASYILALLWLAPPIFLTVFWSDITHLPVEPECRFGRCWDSGRQDPWFVFVLGFPPGWGAYILILLSTERHLAQHQFRVIGIFALLALQVLALIWSAFILRMLIDQIAVSTVNLFFWVVTVIALQGYLIVGKGMQVAFRRVMDPHYHHRDT